MDVTGVAEEVQEEKIGYRTILQQKEYMKVIVANVISRFGDSIDCIAFTWLVYAVTGSAAWTAVIYALNQLPSILLEPFAGVMVEGMKKKRIMVDSDLVRGGVIVLLAVLYMNHMVNPFVLAVFTLIISSVEAFCVPASMALIPKIINKKYFSYATSLNSSLSNVAQLIGIGAAGLIIGGLGIGAAMLIDAATFILSAVLTGMVHVNENNIQRKQWNKAGYMADLKEGFSYIRMRKIIINFCILAVLVNMFTVPISSLQSPMAVEIFGLGSELLSVYGLMFVLGMSLGSILIPKIMEKIPIRVIMMIAGVGIGACFWGYTFGKYTYGQIMPSYLLCGMVSLVQGISFSWGSGVINIQFMKNVEEEYLARAGGIFNACVSAAAPISSLLVGAISVKISVSAIFQITAIGCVVIFVMTGLLKVQMELPLDHEAE